MRAFVALEISEPEVLQKLVELQEGISSTGADVKLVERQNLHFTVKFLGEISEPERVEAAGRLSRLGLRSVTAQMVGVGAFPSTGNPRVVWAGVQQADEEKVRSLVGPVISALDGIGESDSRPFQAHVTLARVRSPRGRQSLAGFVSSNAGAAIGTVHLASLKLKSSLLTTRGPVYEDLEVYHLA